MSDFFPVDAVALPQLRTTCPGESVEIPNVSPGQTDVSPNSGETCTGSGWRGTRNINSLEARLRRAGGRLR